MSSLSTQDRTGQMENLTDAQWSRAVAEFWRREGADLIASMDDAPDTNLGAMLRGRWHRFVDESNGDFARNRMTLDGARRELMGRCPGSNVHIEIEMIWRRSKCSVEYTVALFVPRDRFNFAHFQHTDPDLATAVQKVLRDACPVEPHPVGAKEIDVDLDAAREAACMDAIHGTGLGEMDANGRS